MKMTIIGTERLRISALPGVSGTNTPGISFAESLSARIAAAPVAEDALEKVSEKKTLPPDGALPQFSLVTEDGSVSAIKSANRAAGSEGDFFSKPVAEHFSEAIIAANPKPISSSPITVKLNGLADAESDLLSNEELPVVQNQLTTATLQKMVVGQKEQTTSLPQSSGVSEQAMHEITEGSGNKEQDSPSLSAEVLADTKLQVKLIGHEKKIPSVLKFTSVTSKPAEGGEKVQSQKSAKNKISLDTPIEPAAVLQTQGVETSSVPQVIVMAAPEIQPANTAMVATNSKDSSAAVAKPSLPTGKASTREIQVANASGALHLSKNSDAAERVVTSEPEKGVVTGTSSDSERVKGSWVDHSGEKMHVATFAANSQNIVVSENAVVPVHKSADTVIEKASSPTDSLARVQSDSKGEGTVLYAASEHRPLVVTPTTLEVGVPSGTHGWLKVRAELATDGMVHASMSTSSTANAELLRRELPALTTYLHQEQVSVGSIAVHELASGRDLSGQSGGTGQNREAGGGAENARNGANQEQTTPSRGESTSLLVGTNEDNEADWSLPVGYARGGGWLSVRA